MKYSKFLFLLFVLLSVGLALNAQVLPPDPGPNNGGGASAPLDGGLLMGLLAGGGFLVSLIAGKKKKNK